MLSLLATAALTAAGALSVPLIPPLLPGTEPAPTEQQTQESAVSGTLDAPDGRLKRGCKVYSYSYSVTVPSNDWTLDISMKDRNGKGVNAQSLLGPSDAKSGVLSFRLCRWATVPGRFTLTGLLVSYDHGTETSATVTETFRLRRRNR